MTWPKYCSELWSWVQAGVESAANKQWYLQNGQVNTFISKHTDISMCFQQRLQR